MSIGRSAGMIGMSLGGMIVGGWMGPIFGLGAGMSASLGWLAGSFIGQMVFPTETDTQMPPMAKYPIQRSDKGNPIQICYGTLEVTGNVLWMGPSQPYTIKHTVAEGGLFGDDQYSYETRYIKSFLIGICEGKRYVNRIWRGKDLKPLSVASIYEGDGVNAGLTTELQSAGMTADEVRFANYRHQCCALFVDYDLGNSESLGNWLFEVTEKPPFGGYYAGKNAAYQFDTAYKTVNLWQPPSNEYIINYVDTDDTNGRVLLGNYTPPNVGPWFIHNRDLQTQESITVEEVPGVNADWVDCVWSISCFSGSKDYVYTIFREGFNQYLAKWNSTTGALDWYELVDKWLNIFALASDSNDNAYYHMGRAKNAWWQSDGAASEHVFSAGLDSVYRIVVAEDWLEAGILRPVVIYCGGNVVAAEAIIAYKYDLPTVTTDDDGDDEWDWDSGVVSTCNSPLAKNWHISDAVAINDGLDGCLFALVIDTYLVDPHRVYKFDTNLNSIGFIEIGDAVHVFAVGNRLGVLRKIQSEDIYIDLYDLDLVLLSSTLSEYPGSHPVYGFEDGHGSIYSYYPTGASDANPSAIIEDLLTHERYGCALPISRLDTTSFKEIYDYCEDNDLLISIKLDKSRPIPDWIDYICSHFGGYPYWRGSKFCLGAWKDDSLDFEITRSHLQSPVHVRERKYSETHNRVELTWLNRSDNYGPAVEVAADDVDLRVSGKLRKLQIELPGVKRASLASKLAWRYLFDSMYRFKIYTFPVGYNMTGLQVGRVGLLSDGFKLSRERIRITSLNESKDGKNIDVEAVDDVAYLYPDLATWSWSAEETRRTEDTYVDESDLLSGLIEFREDLHNQRIYISVTPQDANCNGWRIFFSRDGITYSLLSTVTISGVTDGDANSQGTLESDLPAAHAPTWRGDESITVDIGTVTDLHDDVTDSQFFSGQRLARIGEEVIAYKTCEDLGAGLWKITGLIRGLYQTEAVAHVAGETFVTLDPDSSCVFAAADVGSTLYFKAACIYSGELQAEADATAFEYSVVGQYVRPFGLSLLRSTASEDAGGLNRGNYSGADVTLYWNLCGKTAGFNLGAQDGGDTWEYGDDEADLVAQSGVPYASYLQDPDLQGIDLMFYEIDGTFIGQQSLGVVSNVTLTKATDLGGKNPVEVEAYQRHSLRSTRLEEITVDDGS